MNRLRKLQGQLIRHADPATPPPPSAHPTLTHQQLLFFKYHGYLLLTDTSVFQAYQPHHSHQAVTRGLDQQGLGVVQKNESPNSFGQLKKMDNQAQYTVQVLEDLPGNPFLLSCLKNFCKEGRTSYKVSADQSSAFGIFQLSKKPYDKDQQFTYELRKVVIGLLALDDTSPLTQLLYVYPGSQQNQPKQTEGVGSSAKTGEMKEGVRLQMKRGDIVLMHPKMAFAIEDRRPEFMQSQIFSRFEMEQLQEVPTKKPEPKQGKGGSQNKKASSQTLKVAIHGEKTKGRL